jgi:uncharacterized protein (TIGR02452 family)
MYDPLRMRRWVISAGSGVRWWGAERAGRRVVSYISIKLDNDRIWKKSRFPAISSETFFDIKPSEVMRKTPFSLSGHLVNATTIEAILQNTHHARVIALNFANAIVPGGGYTVGGNAQEESLCRSSFLYYSIRTQKKFYRRNLLTLSPCYTDALIYSRNIPVIRDHNGLLLPSPLFCDFITCPAVNRRYAKLLHPDTEIDAIMARRIQKIVSFARLKSPHVLILGAFGCGAFGNKRETVLRLFEESINKYMDDNVEVLFAIPE